MDHLRVLCHVGFFVFCQPISNGQETSIFDLSGNSGLHYPMQPEQHSLEEASGLHRGVATGWLGCRVSATGNSRICRGDVGDEQLPVELTGEEMSRGGAGLFIASS